jgi:hypothetical protein
MIITVDVSTLPKRVRHATLILHAKATDFRYGFKGTTPGRLVRLEPLELLKGNEALLDEYFVFYPVGTFQVGDHKICKTDYRYPAVPEPGDEVVLLILNRPNPDAPMLEPDLYGAESYFTLTGEGVSASNRFQKELQGVDPQTFLQTLRKLMETRTGQWQHPSSTTR